MSQSYDLFKTEIEEKIGRNNPLLYDITDKIQELQNELSNFETNTFFHNIEDSYDNILDNSHNNRIFACTVSASNPLDIQILEELMKLCYKLKSPQKVLQILEMHNKDFNLFD